MHFFRRSPASPARLGVFPGTFNPVTAAHLALATAALDLLDEVVFVLPRQFPHKAYSGATFRQRVELLTLAAAHEPRFSIAACPKGLFVGIAAACRQAYGPAVRLSFLCGRDAAERIVNWDYGTPGAIHEILRQFDLLVAARAGEYQPPAGIAHACRTLQVVPGEWSHVSATGVRERIAAGQSWEHLVPAPTRHRVREIYVPPPGCNPPTG